MASKFTKQLKGIAADRDEVNDMFTRPYVLDRIKFQWDGEKMTFPDELVWEGTKTLTTSN